MARYAQSTRALKALLLVAVALALALCVPRASAAMMDMPDDPVSGEMVMSTAYNFELQNGQRLRFANADSLAQFEKNPASGLGEVRMVETTGTEAATTTAAALCPVCGMETSASGGPQVLMQHGGQAIHACSLFHAHQVHDEMLTLRAGADAAKPAAHEDEVQEAPFCTGPGTAMLNGFAFFSGGRVSSACVLLWFPGWVLNTPWRYVLGCLTVVLCAMFNEYLLKLRRALRKESNAKRLVALDQNAESAKLLVRTRTYSASAQSGAASGSTGVIAKWFRGLSSDAQHMVHCVLHGVTIMLAYMLMLVSMTYDGVLFLCCIVGYVVGYFVFGERREAVPDVDPLGFVPA